MQTFSAKSELRIEVPERIRLALEAYALERKFSTEFVVEMAHWNSIEVRKELESEVIFLVINMNSKSSIALLFAGLSIGILTSPTVAQLAPPDCKNPQTQLDMTLCAGQAAKASDRELNQIYRQVRARYKGTSQENRLVTAQLAWIRFRDAECKVSAGQYEGGSMAPMIYAECVDRLTRQRTQDLKGYLEEG